MKSNDVLAKLDLVIPKPRCELNYQKDYELLIATVLSAQSTDKRVNLVTPILFQKYDIYTLKDADLKDLEQIIYPVGTYKKKAEFIKGIASSLVKDYDGIVPNNQAYLETLPGVGHKTANVVLAEIYGVPTMAVDTHVTRVANRLGLVNTKNVQLIEKSLTEFFPKEKWNRVNHQLILFGRYICKSQKPDCAKCPFQCPESRLKQSVK